MKLATLLLAVSFLAAAQQNPGDSKARARGVRDLAKQGSDGIAAIAPYLADLDLDVRLEAVKALANIGGPRTVEPLITAARDNDPEIQIRATDALVNAYLPGYLKTGISGSLSRAGNAVKAKFSDNNDQIIDPFIQVRPEVIPVLSRLVGGGSSMESRANAARAVGILRGRDAIPQLVEALRSKDDRLMYESLIAVQKIADPSAAPRISFVLRDLDERIQVTALETTGLLRNREAAPEVRDALDHARTIKVKRAAVAALGMLADPADHARFISFLADKDDLLRTGAAEGLARLTDPVDKPILDRAFQAERSTNARLAQAFGVAMLGDLSVTEFAPFRYLVNSLNLKAYKNVAQAYLIELARDLRARQGLYAMLERGSKEERSGLAAVLGASGDKDSVPYLETLSKDPDPDVAAEGVRGLRTLRSRLP